MKEYKIASIAGDGIGQEVVPEAHKVLKKVAEEHQFKLSIDDFDFDGEMQPDVALNPISFESLRMFSRIELLAATPPATTK